MIPTPKQVTESLQIKCTTAAEVEFAYKLVDKLGWTWLDGKSILAKPQHLAEDIGEVQKIGCFYLCLFVDQVPYVMRCHDTLPYDNSAKVIRAADLMQQKPRSSYFCSICNTPMKFLFTSSYCPNCDGE